MEFDPDVATHLHQLAERGGPSLSAMTPEVARAAYVEAARRNGGPVPEMASVGSATADGPAGPIPLRLYRPLGAPERDAPALFYIHGGGFVLGDLDSHDGLCRRLAERSGLRVVAVDYRLAPEHPAPAATEDVVAALRWIVRNAAELGIDAGRLAVAGDSAGGGLAAVAAMAARDEGIALRCQVLAYPSIDNRAKAPDYPSRRTNRDVPPLTPDVLAWAATKYLPDPALGDDWRQSPILGDKAGVAPALVMVGERDPLRSEGLAYADALEDAGVEVSRRLLPGMIHGFLTMSAVLGATDPAIETIAMELRRRLAHAS